MNILMSLPGSFLIPSFKLERYFKVYLLTHFIIISIGLKMKYFSYETDNIQQVTHLWPLPKQAPRDIRRNSTSLEHTFYLASFELMRRIHVSNHARELVAILLSSFIESSFYGRTVHQNTDFICILVHR